MALQKHVPAGNGAPVSIRSLTFTSKENGKPSLAEVQRRPMEADVDVDLREVYFLIMHFLSAGPCQRNFGPLWNELVEHQLLPRRYHAWYSRTGIQSGDENDDGLSFPLSYNNLAERYTHVDKDHLVKLLKQLIIGASAPSKDLSGENASTVASVPTILGTGSFSLLASDHSKRDSKSNHPPSYMRWPHRKADQVRALSLREIGGGFPRHNRAPSIRAACYAIAKPSTMVQKMEQNKKVRGHRNAVYCAIFDGSGRYIITGSDDRLVKIWSMETAYCLASCRGHEGDITDLAVNLTNVVVASASNDCVIRVWRLPDGVPISVLRGHTGAVTAIVFSPRPAANFQLLSSSDDGTCRIWDARCSHLPPRIYSPKPPDPVAGRINVPSSNPVQQSHQIFCCAFNASGTVFVTGSSDTLARVWSACKFNTDDTNQPNHEIDVLSGHENDVNYVQFSGCAIAPRFISTETSKEDTSLKFKNTWLNHDNIVTCSRDGSAIIWIPRSRRSHGKTGRWIRAYHLKVPPPPLPPQPTRGGPRQRILPTPRGVNMIAWSLDNRFVLAAIMDCRICVWNAVDGSLVHSLTGHTDSTYILDVHPFNPRIAMSAGYDGKTIVWDIWEGTAIRTYEIGPFKLVDGKFSPDGTSIILSDDVGQFYILSTGQGESQKDAKYDQFFLGDYRPLIQDTHGNVLDQETQIAPHRRNLQDLLCDSGMIPYPDPYQSMYQQRRLGALGIEWRPTSLKFSTGVDFSLDPDYHMLPIVDLDTLIDPLPEFVDAMDWAPPEIEMHSDDNDSEYHIADDYSSGGERASVSFGSGDPDCSSDNSDIESRRRSKRKKYKPEVEVLTASGRRVKRKNLDECDGSSLRKHRARKSKHRRKASREKSSSKSRPQRAAARNALHLFSRITGTRTADADVNDLDSASAESGSTPQDSSFASEESDENESSDHSKGKDLVDYSLNMDTAHVNGTTSKRRLILKLPNRHTSGSTSREGQPEVAGSSSRIMSEIEPNSENNGCRLDLIGESKDGSIKWGGSKARTSSKRLKMGTRVSDDLHKAEDVINGNSSSVRENGINFLSQITQNQNGILDEKVNLSSGTDDMPENVEKISGLDESRDNGRPLNGSHEVCNGKENGIETNSESKENGVNTSTKLRIRFDRPIDPEKTSMGSPPEKITRKSHSGEVCDLVAQSEGPSASALEEIVKPDSEKKMFVAVYKRSKSSRAKHNLESDSAINNEASTSNPEKYSIDEASTSTAGKHNLDEGIEIAPEGIRRARSIRIRSTSRVDPVSPGSNLRINGTYGHSEDTSKDVEMTSPSRGEENSCEEWRTESRNSVRSRSTRSKKSSHYTRDIISPERRKPNHIGKSSWLLLCAHEEGSRYIPQRGDEVAYLRQGHQEYLSYSNSRILGPWETLKRNIRDVEFCRVEDLEYSTQTGSGESCCKISLKFTDFSSDVLGKSFKLTLPEMTGFPDFLVERSRYDTSVARNWTKRDKCQVWWKNEGDEDGSWWEGRILDVKPKSDEFPVSPWERYVVKYKSDPTETHLHSPWELFDTDTHWEQPHIDDEDRDKLLRAFSKLDQSGYKTQDYYGVNKLKQASQKTNYMNRFPVPISLEIIDARLQNNYYRSVEAMKHDVEVMLSSAETHFGRNAELSTKVKRLSDWFKKTLSSL